MKRLCFIKRDKEVARLYSANLVKGGGVYIHYYFSEGLGCLRVAIRISSKCHRKAVVRNRLRRWIKEILRNWLNINGLTIASRDLNLLINVCIKQDQILEFSSLREQLFSLLGDILC